MSYEAATDAYVTSMSPNVKMLRSPLVIVPFVFTQAVAFSLGLRLLIG